MSGDEPPCLVRHRHGAVLVVAPHGGLRATDGPHQRANDLHTGALAAALAERLDGSLVVNDRLDRNRLDLNRMRTVTEHAPWFAAFLHDVLVAILARHRAACVVFVHGWHVMQPRCDIGVGARLGGAADAAAVAGVLTASPEWLGARIEPFRRACGDLGVRATYGERWPGAHPNNLLQAFRRRPRKKLTGPVAEIAALAASGRIEALQLELGAPLRWPGHLRESFVDALARMLAPSSGRAGPTTVSTDDRSVGRGDPGVQGERGETAHVRRLGCGEITQVERPARGGGPTGVGPPGASRIALQLHDPVAGARGLGLVAGIAHLPDGDTGARLVLFPGGSRMAIFVGHERGHGTLAVDGLEIAANEGGFELAFAGHLLLAEDGESYFRDERAQGEARLVRASAVLCYRANGGSGYGKADGRVVLDGQSFEVDGFGFTTPFLAPPRSQSSSQTRALASFGSGLALVAETEAESLRLGPRGEEALGRARVVGDLEADGAWFALDLASAGRLECRPQNRVQVWRPLPGGGAARVTFGVAHFQCSEGGAGSGFYERIEVAGRTSGDPEAGASSVGD